MLAENWIFFSSCLYVYFEHDLLLLWFVVNVHCWCWLLFKMMIIIDQNALYFSIIFYPLDNDYHYRSTLFSSSAPSLVWRWSHVCTIMSDHMASNNCTAFYHAGNLTQFWLMIVSQQWLDMDSLYQVNGIMDITSFWPNYW